MATGTLCYQITRDADPHITLSVLHPTARVEPSTNFPNAWGDTYRGYADRCKYPAHVEYILSVHHSRWNTYLKHWQTYMRDGGWGSVKVLVNRGRDCVVDQLNLCAQSTDPGSQIMIGAMDDMTPPQDWDVLVKNSFPTFDEPCVMQYSSGNPRDEELTIAGAINRKWYDKVGYALYPEYTSMYADDDLTATAKNAGALHKAHNIKFDHQHPINGGKQWDDIYANQNNIANAAWGAQVLKRRKAEGFPC